MNKVFLSGNLTRDVDFKESQSGTAYAKTGLAVKRIFSKDDETDFFNLTAFGRTAEFMQKYLQKGSRVLVEGKIQISTNEVNGEKKTYTDIIIDNIEFAGSKKIDESEKQAPQKKAYAHNKNYNADMDFDIIENDDDDDISNFPF